MTNESTMVNSKNIMMFRCNAWSNSLCNLTRPRGATYIQINIDTFYL